LVQFAAQGGLIDHPRGSGFVIQRRPIDRHYHTVGANLAIGHDHMGVQVRVAAPGRLVLIGDRHQSGQPHKVFLPGARIVDSRVSRMNGQIFHRLGHRGGVRVGDRLGHHVIGAQCPDERHTLGCAERQVEPVHAALPEGAPLRTDGSDAVVEPAGHQFRISLSAGALHIGQAHQSADGVGVAGQQPCGGAGFMFGVVLPQPPTRARQITAGGRGGMGGVYVVADRPPLQLGDRQHQIHHPWRLRRKVFSGRCCGTYCATTILAHCSNVRCRILRR
jgi:hypothetical protein